MDNAQLKERESALRAQVRGKLAEIPQASLQEMLAKSRWNCDSHWMMALVINAGWETANRVNLEVVKATGKTEMHRLMKLVGIKEVSTDEEFGLLVMMAMAVFTTSDYWEYETRGLPSGDMKAYISRCYAYTKTRSIGVERDYECGCFGLRAGWYEAMGVDVEEVLIRCLKDGDSQCEIHLEKRDNLICRLRRPTDSVG